MVIFFDFVTGEYAFSQTSSTTSVSSADSHANALCITTGAHRQRVRGGSSLLLQARLQRPHGRSLVLPTRTRCKLPLQRLIRRLQGTTPSRGVHALSEEGQV